MLAIQGRRWHPLTHAAADRMREFHDARIVRVTPEELVKRIQEKQS